MADTAAQFGNLKSDAGVAKLNDFMSSHSYVTGYSPTQDDVIILKKLLGAPNKDKMPHASRWYRHIDYVSDFEQKKWPKGAMKAAPEPKAEEEFDLFGDETEADKEASSKLTASMKEKAGEGAAKKKKEVINKSSLVLEIKPYDCETDLSVVHSLVKNIAMEGLTWGEAHKKVPVAFGLYKLQVCCTIIDDLVNTNEITDQIEELGMTDEHKKEWRAKRESGGGEEDEEEEEECVGLVQSVEIVSFNKL